MEASVPSPPCPQSQPPAAGSNLQGGGLERGQPGGGGGPTPATTSHASQIHLPPHPPTPNHLQKNLKAFPAGSILPRTQRTFLHSSHTFLWSILGGAEHTQIRRTYIPNTGMHKCAQGDSSAAKEIGETGIFQAEKEGKSVRTGDAKVLRPPSMFGKRSLLLVGRDTQAGLQKLKERSSFCQEPLKV